MRYELKYIINPIQYAELKPALAALCERDSHVNDNGEYDIRSIYFDDFRMSALWDKINGVDERKKYRVRYYNNSLDYCTLECKIKKGSHIDKKSERITKEGIEALLRADGLYKGGELYREVIAKGLKPVTVVDYVREPYVLPYSDIRITFDKEIARGDDFDDLLAPKRFPDILSNGDMVLEVKYNEYLPEHISRIISGIKPIQLPVSKYVLCVCENAVNTAGSLDFINNI